MRKLTLCVVGLMLIASPAMAQMGGGGGGVQGVLPSGAGTPDDDDSNKVTLPREMKPISEERFDRAVSSMFRLADVNHDGMVTLAEFQSVVDARRAEVIRDHFQEIDLNRDGKIDFNEFVAWQSRLGSAAFSECAGYAGQAQIVPEKLLPEFKDNDTDDGIALVIEPLSELTITRANTHYRPGITLDDLLVYENARFDRADTNHDGYLEQVELTALRQAAASRTRPR